MGQVVARESKTRGERMDRPLTRLPDVESLEGPLDLLPGEKEAAGVHKGKISDWQAFVLLSLTTISTPVFTQPSKAYWILGYGGWQLILVGGAVAAIGIIASGALAKRFPRDTYVRYSRASLGRLFGAITAFALALWYFAAGAHDSFLMGRAVKLALLYETPIEAIFIGGALGVIYLAWGGLERLARFAEVSLIVIIPLLIFMMLTPMQHAEPGNLLPVFLFPARQYTTLKFWLAAYMYRGFAILYMIQPYMANPHRAGTIAFWSTVVAAAFFALTFAYPVMVFGMEVSRVVVWPFWTVVRITRFSGFPVEKLLYFATVAWHLMTTVSSTVFLYLTGTTLAELVGLRQYRPLLFLLTPAWAVVSLMPRSYMQFHMMDDAYVALGWVATIILPMVVLLVSRVRQVKGGE
ncbi:MAG TPA: endospore germination permease [Firmicutes bacterium]|nr:endospore germination permease [Bacillota bacterium]